MNGNEIYFFAFSDLKQSSMPFIGGGSLTCHSCKHVCSDVWSLLKHVFIAHGLRICEVNFLLKWAMPAFYKSLC